MVFFIQILMEHSARKQWGPDQTPRSAAPGLGLHNLPKDARRIWVNILSTSYAIFESLYILVSVF